MKTVLNIGGQSKDIPLPEIFDGWKHVLLDIEEGIGADIVADARDLSNINERFNAIYCSHVLEHFYIFEVPSILLGFRKVLKKDGFVLLRVPDIQQVLDAVGLQGKRFVDPLYQTTNGGITPLDIFYGHQGLIASGKPYYEHHCAFTKDMLEKLLRQAGFTHFGIEHGYFELTVVAEV